MKLSTNYGMSSWISFTWKTMVNMQVLHFNYREKKKKQSKFQEVPSARKLIFMCLQQGNLLLLRYILQQVYYKLWTKMDTGFFLHLRSLSGFLLFIYWNKSDTASGIKASPGVKQFTQWWFPKATCTQLQLRKFYKGQLWTPARPLTQSPTESSWTGERWIWWWTVGWMRNCWMVTPRK